MDHKSLLSPSLLAELEAVQRGLDALKASGMHEVADGFLAQIGHVMLARIRTLKRIVDVVGAVPLGGQHLRNGAELREFLEALEGQVLALLTSNASDRLPN